MNTPHRSLVNWLILGLLAIIWGSSYILMKKALLVFSWDQIAGLRITYSFIAVLPLAFWYARRFSSKTIVALLVVGLAGSGIPSFLFPYAQTVLDSGLTGILNALTPLFTLLLGVWFFKTKSSVLKIVGVVVGMGGAVMLMVFQPDGTIGFKNYEYGFFVLLATFCYALSTNVIKSALQNIHPVTIAVMSFLMIGPFGATYLFSTDFTSVVKAHPDVVQGLVYVGLLSLFGTVISIIIFFKLVQRTDAVFGSIVTYLIPIVAIFWGLLDGEQLVLMQYLGMALILGGVYLTSNTK